MSLARLTAAMSYLACEFRDFAVEVWTAKPPSYPWAPINSLPFGGHLPKRVVFIGLAVTMGLTFVVARKAMLKMTC